ncbi:MAG: histidine phosphatase family protein [Acidimicrobiales bacterium]
MTAAPITYVRHAMPRVEDGVDSAHWHLDDATRASARAWAERLEVGPGIAALVTSTEPKALETAAAIAERWPTEVHEDDRLREAVRPWIGTGYRAMAHAYLRGEPLDGWEPHGEVATRVGAAVRAAQEAAAGGPVVIVGHGLALSIHLGDQLGADFDRESFWSRLAFPDAWVLDRGELHRSLPSAAERR